MRREIPSAAATEGWFRELVRTCLGWEIRTFLEQKASIMALNVINTGSFQQLIGNKFVYQGLAIPAKAAHLVRIQVDSLLRCNIREATSDMLHNMDIVEMAASDTMPPAELREPADIIAILRRYKTVDDSIEWYINTKPPGLVHNENWYGKLLVNIVAGRLVEELIRLR